MDDALVEKVSRDTWNAAADTWNSWDNLSETEQSVFREAVVAGVKEGLEMAAEHAERYPSNDWHDIAVIRGIATAIRSLGPRP